MSGQHRTPSPIAAMVGLALLWCGIAALVVLGVAWLMAWL